MVWMVEVGFGGFGVVGVLVGGGCGVAVGFVGGEMVACVLGWKKFGRFDDGDGARWLGGVAEGFAGGLEKLVNTLNTRDREIR